jgi:hypothetical protein
MAEHLVYTEEAQVRSLLGPFFWLNQAAIGGEAASFKYKKNMIQIQKER